MKIRNSKLEIQNRMGFTPHHFYFFKKNKSGAGFTLVEMIIYIAIVGIILTAISYLMIEIMSGQSGNYVDQEVNYNIRYISNFLIKDIKSAQDIGSLTTDTLVLTMSGDDITYNFDGVENKLTRQVGVESPIRLNSARIEATGGFTDLSYQGRAKNVGINLIIEFYNPDNLTDYNSSTTVDFAVELRGRR